MKQDPLAAGNPEPTKPMAWLAVSLEQERARRARLDASQVKDQEEIEPSSADCDPSYWLG